MKNNPLLQLQSLGQSFWLDYIRRDLISGGGLKRLIAEDGLRGMTSNPAIFEKGITESREYDTDIQTGAMAGMNAKTIYEMLSRRDVQMAADEFRPVYDELAGEDGYVSLEVDPHLAHDTQGTIKEARRMWVALNRPNVFIKVPATIEGLPVITQLTNEGINVNVTLLFGLPRYRQVAEAYLEGIEARLTRGADVSRLASVASFFVSRTDALVDPLLEKISASGGEHADLAKKTIGETAIASAKMAYQIYKEIFGSNRFRGLAARGARFQRVLWASTGTKNPDYEDVKYVEALIGPDTINTLPVETLNAFRDHGIPRARLEEDIDKAAGVLAGLPELGIKMDVLNQQLEDEGVQKFSKPLDKLLATLEQRSLQYLSKKT